MTLSDLASIGALVSSAAVLISLVYLSLQLRMTERNQRALINQGVLTRTVEMVRWNAEPYVSELVTRVSSGEVEFSAEEINRLRLILRVRLSNFQDAYVQRRLGLVDPITYENAHLGVVALIAQPVFRAMWRRHAPTYSPELVEVIEGMIAKTALLAPVDTVAQFKSDLVDLPVDSASGSAPPG